MKNSIIICFITPIFLLLTTLQTANAQWSLSGNTPSATDFLGTTGAQDLVFKTNSTERMRLLGLNGNFGIGTAAPSQKLQLSGGNMLLDFSNSGATQGNIFFGNPTFGAGSGNGMRHSYFNGTTGSNLGGYIDVRTPTLNNDGLIFRVDATNGSSERMRICANGKVGIGTGNPAARLEVKTGSVMTTNPLNSNDGILFKNSAGMATFADWGIQYWQNNVHASEPGGLNFWKPFGATTGAFQNYILFLQDDGKVKMGEVGTTLTGVAGNYRLFVKDGILTEKVLVMPFPSANWNWPDYVFEASHRLRPLEEVEAFVKTEKHLPGVPSAAEVNKDGIELAKMNAILLEKVEELTLYLVDMNKRLKILEQENQALKTTQATTPACANPSTFTQTQNASNNEKH